jgi:hypothetical protein
MLQVLKSAIIEWRFTERVRIVQVKKLTNKLFKAAGCVLSAFYFSIKKTGCQLAGHS